MYQYRVLGVMSGSSLDGLDLCYAVFRQKQGVWSYQILGMETINISKVLKSKLRCADQLSGLDLYQLDTMYGEWVGEQLVSWLQNQSFSPTVIGFHGHTVFHEPSNKISVQIGSGQAIALQTGIPVVDHFRSQDVLKGGQGAPLVPVGEHYLMPQYEGFINLGGIANISIHKAELEAWDLAPCNQVLNYFSSKLGLAYDEGGKLAASGGLDENWLHQLSELEYFKLPPPKSLSNQWTSNILQGNLPEPKDALATYTMFLGELISKELMARLGPSDRVLVTGGGAYNDYLIGLIQNRTRVKLEIIVPEMELISFKEALIFGFLGLLRMENQPNIFCRITGASSDTCAGLVHHPN